MTGKILQTWQQAEKTFCYEGSVKTGTTIHYGEGHRFTAKISAADYQRLLKQFPPGEYAVGTAKTDPPPESVGRWMKDNVNQTGLMSYVGAILREENYATRPKAGRIQFRSATHK
jgi:hypothetical protein